MAHLRENTWGFVNLQKKFEKVDFKVKKLGQKLLLFFENWLIAPSKSEQILSGNCAKLCLMENGGHFEHFLNVSMHIEE